MDTANEEPVHAVSEKLNGLDINDNLSEKEPAAGDLTTQTTTAEKADLPVAADSAGQIVELTNKLSGLGLKPEVAQSLATFALEELSSGQEDSIRSYTEKAEKVTVLESGTERAITLVAKAAIMQQLDPETLEHQLLVLTANRYAALQVTRIIRALADGHKLRARACIGGHPLHMDQNALRTGVQIVVGTTGRVIDLLERCILNTSYFKVLVLENANEMLTFHRYEVFSILKKLPPDVRIVLLSAAPQEPDVLLKEMDALINADPEEMEKQRTEYRTRSSSRTGRKSQSQSQQQNQDQQKPKKRNLKRRRQSGGSSTERTEEKASSAESSPTSPADDASPVTAPDDAAPAVAPIVAASA